MDSHPFILYAIRLGYTEDDAFLAISRLGPAAITNDLLTLVISLHARTERCDEEIFALKRANRAAGKRMCAGFSTGGLSRAAGS